MMMMPTLMKRFGLPPFLVTRILSIFYLLLMVSLLLPHNVTSCGPGRGGNRRRSPRKLTPLVFKQHVPNVSENTISASGFKEGKITRHDPRFKDLVPNYNPDIIFKDEEGTGADRLMTRRLKEKLDTLAISVMNQWPGVRLRVTEGWDEEAHHATDSLHYEGRAVDITTSDRDRSKYGMLARLAVEAGFDWVYYESRYHIHCSVKSEKSDAARNGGCFDKSSRVITPEGSMAISDLRVGDSILSVNSDGKSVFSPVIMFLDRDPSANRTYYTIKTTSERSITLTGSHLIFVMEDEVASVPSSSFQHHRVQYASRVSPGQFVLIRDEDSDEMRVEKVLSIQVNEKSGAFAPLTIEGNLIVNDVMASCYADINSQSLAHLSFLPVRMYYWMSDSFSHLIASFNHQRLQDHERSFSSSSLPIGIHWYPRLLQSIARTVLPSSYFTA